MKFRKPYDLIPRSVANSSVYGRVEALTGEKNVLTNPLVDEANRRILHEFTPSHDTVIFSLCTSTRPYYKSQKWSHLLKTFGGRADMVICSNGGVIPMEFSHCWPFMTYDAGRKSSEFDEVYKEVMARRVTEFLDAFPYEKVIHVFLPHTRNAAAVREYGLPGALVPSDEVLSEARGTGWNMNYNLYPVKHPLITRQINDLI